MDYKNVFELKALPAMVRSYLLIKICFGSNILHICKYIFGRIICFFITLLFTARDIYLVQETRLPDSHHEICQFN